MAAGDLHAWSALTGATRLLGEDAAVISVKRSPNARSAGYLQVLADASGENPPSTRLRTSRIVGLQRTVSVAADATAFVLGDYGRVVYATSAGVFDAVAY